MKVIKSETGFLVYQKIFKFLQANHSSLVVWQILPDSGKRQICSSRLNSFHLESKLLHLELSSNAGLLSTEPLYCYAEDGQLIFKTSIQELREANFSVAVPTEIKLLEDEEVTIIRGQVGLDLASVWKVKRLQLDVNDFADETVIIKSMAQRSTHDQAILNEEFNLSVDEEDKLFAGVRESTRARPKKDKWVKLMIIGEDSKGLFRLFDLSQGGMAFVTAKQDIFSKGTQLYITGFDEVELDDPLIGKVVAVRPIDDSKFKFKIGVKFEDGQN